MLHPQRNAILLAGIAIIALAPAASYAKERTSSWQRSNGQTGTTTMSKSRNADGSGWSKSRATTRDDGKKSSSEKNVTKTDSGYAVSGSHTGANGNTQTYNKDVTKTEDGYTATGSYEGSNGKSGTFTQTGTKTEDGRIIHTEATNQNGETSTRDATTSHTNGTATKEVTQTGFKGKVRNWTRSGTYNN